MTRSISPNKFASLPEPHPDYFRCVEAAFGLEPEPFLTGDWRPSQYLEPVKPELLNFVQAAILIGRCAPFIFVLAN